MTITDFSMFTQDKWPICVVSQFGSKTNATVHPQCNECLH